MKLSIILLPCSAVILSAWIYCGISIADIVTTIVNNPALSATILGHWIASAIAMTITYYRSDDDKWNLMKMYEGYSCALMGASTLAMCGDILIGNRPTFYEHIKYIFGYCWHLLYAYWTCAVWKNGAYWRAHDTNFFSLCIEYMRISSFFAILSSMIMLAGYIIVTAIV